MKSENRAAEAERTVSKLQKEIDRLEGLLAQLPLKLYVYRLLYISYTTWKSSNNTSTSFRKWVFFACCYNVSVYMACIRAKVTGNTAHVLHAQCFL